MRAKLSFKAILFVIFTIGTVVLYGEETTLTVSLPEQLVVPVSSEQSSHWETFTTSATCNKEPTYDHTEEKLGDKIWSISVTGADCEMQDASTQDWGECTSQNNNSSFSLRIKCNEAKSSTISVTIERKVDIFDISADLTATPAPTPKRTETVSGTATLTAWFVGIDSIQYKRASDSDWQSATDTIYVPKDAILSFKVNKEPTDAPSWPDNFPTWTGVKSGTGETITDVKFNTVSTSSTNYKVETAKCGVSEKSANVVVYDFASLTVKETAHTNNYITMPGSSTTFLYVCEQSNNDTKITLSVTLTPDIASEKKWVRWKVEGSNASPASGNFDGNSVEVTLIPQESDRTFTVKAGIDSNRNNTLDTDEVSQTIDVVVMVIDTVGISGTNQDNSQDGASAPSTTEICFSNDPGADVQALLTAMCKPNIPEVYQLALWKITGDRVLAPYDGSLPTTSQDITFSPYGNHTYKLEAGFDTNRDGNLQTSEVTHTMTIKILNVKVLAEDAGGAVGAVPLTECMYNRIVTYTAKIPAWTSFDGDVTYKFKRTVPVSILIPNGIMTDTETARASSASISAYPGNFHIKKHTTETIVTASYKGVTATSSSLYIDLYKPDINKFKDHTDQKDWMICVGRNIEYEANASSDCQNFAWDLKSGTFFDYWQITGGNAKSGTSMLIPLSELEAASGTHFGDTYGNVRVQFNDGDNNSYSFESSDMNPSQKAKVFFPRDYMLNGAACPAWYKFWAKDQGGPGMHYFGSTSVENNVRITWEYNNSISGSGRTNFSYTNLFGAYATIAFSNRAVGKRNWSFASPSITFTDSTGALKTFPIGTISLSFIKDDFESIDCVIQTARHEIQHTKRLYLKYATSVSDPDGDRLPSSFEDSLGTNWNQQTTYTSFYLTGFDDEIDCEKEAQTPMPSASASQDWSYPGKQWH